MRVTQGVSLQQAHSEKERRNVKQTVLHVVVGDVLFQSQSASALDRGLPWLFGKPWSQHDLRTDVVGQALVGASSGFAGGPYRYELAADIWRYLLFFM